MGTAQDDRVDIRVELHELVDTLLDEIVCAGRVSFIVFYQGHPERTGLSRHFDIGPKLSDLHVVAMALHRAFCGEQSHMAVACELSDDFCRRPDDAEHTPLGIPLWQIMLLDRAQRFCRCGVTAKDHQLTAHLEELLYGLTREFIDDIKRARAIRSSCVVAKIDIIVLRQQLSDAMQYGQSAIAGIKNAYGARCWRERLLNGLRLLGLIINVCIHLTTPYYN